MIGFEPELLTSQHSSSKARYYSAADYHELYKTGRATPLQVIETLLGLTTGTGKYSDAWADAHGAEKLAVEAAKASTERWAAGKPLGILDGVPIGVKDDTEVKGYVSHFGMKYNASLPFFAPQEETVWPVKKLQEAGAIVLGKNKMHELGSGTVAAICIHTYGSVDVCTDDVNRYQRCQCMQFCHISPLRLTC